MENKSIPQSQSSLGFFGIIRESVKTTIRNRNLLVPILLLSFLSFSLLKLAEDHLQAPFIKNVVLQLANPNMLRDLRRNLDLVAYRGALDDILEVILLKHITVAFSSITKLLFLVAIVSSSYEAYTAKVLSPKDMFLKIRTSWENPLLTSFCMILITLGIICLYLTSYGITTILAVNSWSFVFSRAITLTIPVCYFYVNALWMVSVVVSVLEEGFGGFKAIGRAADIMKGKRLQASLIMVPFLIADAVVFHMTYALLSNWKSCRSNEWKNAIWISLSNGSECLLKLFMFVVYTVFYHERKTSLDEKEVKVLYLPIAATDA